MYEDGAITLSQKRHCSELLKEAFEEIQSYNYKLYRNENFYRVDSYFWKFMQGLNFLVFGKIGFFILSKKQVMSMYQKYSYFDSAKWSTCGTMNIAFGDHEKLNEIYNLLADKESKETFDWFVKFRTAYAIMGGIAKDIFPYRKSVDSSNKKKVVKRRIGLTFDLDGYVVKGKRYEIVGTWENEQYSLGSKCEPEQGDVVISAGAFEGESTLWFVKRVGAKGKVYAFEPLIEGVKKIQENLSRNHIEENVKIVNIGLWGRKGSVTFDAKRNCSYFVEGEKGNKLDVITLDSYVESEKIEKIDFIKIHVESGELEVLKGAMETIKKFKPKLAVSVYHAPGDIIDIPNYIKSLVPEYKIYLSHKVNDWSGTLVFASPK